VTDEAVTVSSGKRFQLLHILFENAIY